MPNVLAFFALIGATLAGPITLAAADQVPRFNVEPSCRAAAARARSPDYASVCMQKEQRARTMLEQSWSQFKSADRAHCMPLSSLGGAPTFTELLTCLELARDARALRSPLAPATTGRATK